MYEVTVEQLAKVVGTSVEKLLGQMQKAGLKQCESTEIVSDQDKTELLNYLKKIQGEKAGYADVVAEEAKRIIQARKKQQTIKIADNTGKKKIVNVEVRKKRVIDKKNTKSPIKDKQKIIIDNQKSVSSDKRTKKPKNKPEIPAQPNLINENLPIALEEKNVGNKRRNAKKRNSKNERFDIIERHGRKERQQEEARNRKTFQSKALEQSFTKPTAPIVRYVTIPETITVGELAQKMAIKAADVVKFMFKLGSMVTINQVIDQETAIIVVEEMGHKAKLLKEDALEESLVMETENVTSSYELKPRSPVVTVMGHVDHGKTSLLDYIRKTRIQIGEAGGITQHIGAYHVETSKGMICFLDTPGHSAFTAMRARGAKVTDIVILVVAADDGVMPQTEEAINHAKAANVPLVVAINKIDKPNTDPSKIKTALGQHNVIPEDWGGDVQFIEVSAHTGEGIDALLDAILLQAELLELTAPQLGNAKGVVIESRLDRGRGPVASVLVQSGLLQKGDNILIGQQYGRIRAMLDENGKSLNQAGPSIPVEILGLDGPPQSGDEMIVVNDERKAREIAVFRQGKIRETKLARQQASKMENIFKDIESEGIPILKIVLKTDVRGSLEAITHALGQIIHDEVKVMIISGGVGGITETDANLAVASNGVLIGFNVRADSAARKIIENENLDLRYYSIIYEMIEDIKKALSGMLKAESQENIVGTAEVRNIFRTPKLGAIAGCMVIEGTVYRNERIRVLRENIVIFEGELESLRRYKEDVSDVRNGMECGIGVKNYNDIKIGDKIEVYKTVEISRSL